MPRLTFRLLGGVEVLAEPGRPLTMPTRKSQALLGYLALSPGISHPRDKLTALLWGDRGDRQARHSLRQALFTLRKVLVAATGAADVLVVGEHVALDPAMISVDAGLFERRAREGTAQALEDAMDLYRGDLLEGLPVSEPGFEEWLLPERERLRELAQEVLARLVVLHEKQGALDFAVRAAQRLLAFDPLQEAAHRALMRLYSRDGRRGAALRQYQTCLDLLQRELGTEPEPETRELYHDLLRRRRAEAPSPRAPETGAGPVVARGGTALIGRDEEIRRLRQAFDGACGGEGAVVAIVGEAGVGKSRLLEELAAAAQARGARVVMARAHEMEGALPLGPWIDGLQGALRGSASLVEGLSPVWTAHLGHILPDLWPSTARPARAADDAQRLYEAVAQLLGHLASRAPLLVALEDLHWADETSLNLLSFVSRRLAGQAVLLVITVQEEERTPSLTRLLRTLDEQGGMTLRLGRLSRSATQALVRALVGKGHRVSARSLGAQVWSLSEGNPFMVVEAVRAAGERRRPTAAAHVPLPDRIRNVVLARLERLAGAAQRLVAAAAVIGREFEFTLLWRVVRLDERQTAEGVEELVRRGLLRASGELLAFTHDSIRRVAAERLLAPTRRELHHASAEALEALYAGRLEGVHDRLAHHWTEAGSQDRAIGYLTAAAEQNLRHYALPEAIGAFERAIELTEQRTGPDQDRRLVELCLRLAFALSVQGRFDELLALLHVHQPRLARVGDPMLAALFHFRFALTQLYRGELADCVAAADRALAAATAAGQRTVAGQAHYVLAFHDYWVGRPQSGVVHAREAVTCLQDAGQPHWLGLSCWILARNLLLLGDFDASVEIAARTTAIGVAIDDPRLRSLGGATTASVQILLGDVESGLAGCRRARDEAADPVTIGSALHWLGVALIEAGAADEAVRALEESMQRYRASGLRLAQGRSVATLAEAYRLRGDPARARALAEESLRLTRDDPFGWGMAHRSLARAALEMGALADAERHAQESLRSFGAIEAKFEVARARSLLAEISAPGLPSASARG